MKRLIYVLVGMLTLSSHAVLAGEDQPVRSISVSGTVATETVPNQIVWNISLTETDKDLRAAKQRNDRKMARVQDLRETLGIAPQDMQTGNLSVIREYERDGYGGRGEFKQFRLTRTITVRQHDLQRFDVYLDALVASADMEVSFNYHSTREHELRAETRLKALKVAKDKAAAMAEVVGAKLGRVLTLSESGGEPRIYNYRFDNNSVYADEAPQIDYGSRTFVPTDMTVRVTVNATFELE